MDTQLYPLPETVCAYGTRTSFESSRKESGQWVFWEDRVELVLAKRYDEIKPLHVELSPTYLCNFACPWCSCRTAREDWTDEDVFNHPNATELTVMSEGKIHRVLEHLAKYKIGIQWVGGEPTMHPLLYPVALKANELGLKQCLFTNGSLLNLKRLETLFDAEFIFVRVSLDAVTKSVHEVHHGYSDKRDYAERVLKNVRELVKRRCERNASTLIGISIVVDERNLADVRPTARFLCELCEQFGPGAVDYAVLRPTYQFYNAQLQLKHNTGAKLADLIGAGSEVRSMLENAGISVVAPKDSFLTSDYAMDRFEGKPCLSCGWFSEVTPAGDMVICSDRYGNPDYFIGNLAESNIDELWQGTQRTRTLRMVNETSCFNNCCPRNGRGFHLNRIFHEIEAFRDAGKIDDVRKWIVDLRKVLPVPEHSFFL